MTQHQIAKWSDADIIIYIGCGERGNEMTQVSGRVFRTSRSEIRKSFDGQNDADRQYLEHAGSCPRGIHLHRTYTGEYYRDMGYDVAIMADSTSRWAEALRAVRTSGRDASEEGFPAYLASRLSAFYERAGMMQTLNGATGSVSIIGAVSPQGGDFSEPLRRIPSVSCAASGDWINPWRMRDISLRSTG